MTVNDIIAKCGKTINVLILVKDEHDNPIKNAEVFVNLKPVGYTNESGEIKVGLKPGIYLITAKKKGYLPGAKLTVTVTEEDVKNKVEELIENAKKKAEMGREAVEGFLKTLNVENLKVVRVSEEFEIKVTFEGKPVSDATVVIKKNGIVVQSGKTDANGVFRTIEQKSNRKR